MKKFSAMIVDDSETDRYLLKRFLEKTELIGDIFEQNNGEAALDFLSDYACNKEKSEESFPPTLLFLDINMPKMNGFEFLESYQNLIDKYDDMSIVVMMFTSSVREEDMNKAFKFNCVKDYLEKGNFKVEELKKKIIQYT